MTFNSDIQKTEREIAVLQKKLELLKEIEVHKSQVEKEPVMMLMRQGNVDIVDYDHKTYYRIQYTDSFSGTYVWFVRRRGDENIRQVRNVNQYGILEDYYQKEVLKQKEEYPYKKYTPEETAKELRDDMRKAKEDGVFVVDDPPEYDEVEWDEKDNPTDKSETSTIYKFLIQCEYGEANPDNFDKQIEIETTAENFVNYLYEECEILEEDDGKLVVSISKNQLAIPNYDY